MPVPVPVTLLYGGLNALLVTFLGIQVSRARAHDVGVEKPVPKEIIRTVRAHGNAIEWVPLGLVLLLVIELSGAGSGSPCTWPAAPCCWRACCTRPASSGRTSSRWSARRSPTWSCGHVGLGHRHPLHSVRPVGSPGAVRGLPHASRGSSFATYRTSSSLDGSSSPASAANSSRRFSSSPKSSTPSPARSGGCSTRRRTTVSTANVRPVRGWDEQPELRADREVEPRAQEHAAARDVLGRERERSGWSAQSPRAPGGRVGTAGSRRPGTVATGTTGASRESGWARATHWTNRFHLCRASPLMA